MSKYGAVFTVNEFRAQPGAQAPDVGVLVPVARAGEKVRRTLQEISRLWDLLGQRGLPRSQSAYGNAQRYVRRSLLDDDLMLLEIMPVDDGSLLFEWRVASDTYQLEFCADGSTECNAFDAQGRDLDYDASLESSLSGFSRFMGLVR